MRVPSGVCGLIRHSAWLPLSLLLASCGDGGSAPTIYWDAGRIAFSTEDGSFLLVGGGGDPLPLTAPGFQFIQAPNLSPDGTRIAFSGLEEGAQDYRIYVAGLGDENIEGTPTAVLGFEGAYVSEPRWSPDGRMLAATRAGPGLEVWVVGADGANPRRLAEPALQPDWSPDGRSIAFARPDGGPFRVSVIAAAGGEPRDVSGPTCNDTCFSQWLPRWRPDGRLSIVHTTQDAQDLILTVNADGSGVDTTWVTEGRQVTYGVAWSPDGDILAISQRTHPTDYSAQVDLYAVAPMARITERLTSTSDASEIVHDWR